MEWTSGYRYLLILTLNLVLKIAQCCHSNECRRMGWAGHVARMGEITYAIFWLENMTTRKTYE